MAMSRNSGRPTNRDAGFSGALRELARHRPDRALEPLRASVADCSAGAKGELARRLYWLAVALLRLERTELAIKSLASAQKLRPRGHARSAYLHRVNMYGMPRRATPELDDFWAFYSIQACKYLASRPGRRFAAMAEKDIVTRIIAGAWVELRGSGRLEGVGVEARLSIFSKARLAFPTPVGLASGWNASVGREAAGVSSCGDSKRVDFRRGRRVRSGDRCPCGSGLPYCQCCGRTKSPLEFDD